MCGLVSLIRIAITPAGEVILFQNQEQFGIGCIFVRIQIENTDKIAGDSGKNIPSDKGEIKNKCIHLFTVHHFTADAECFFGRKFRVVGEK